MLIQGQVLAFEGGRTFLIDRDECLPIAKKAGVVVQFPLTTQWAGLLVRVSAPEISQHDNPNRRSFVILGGKAFSNIEATTRSGNKGLKRGKRKDRRVPCGPPLEFERVVLATASSHP